VTTHALPPQGANFANLRDPSIDALAWIADTDPDSGRRRAAFQGIHEQLIDSAVVLPIYFVKDGLVLSERVGGYSADDPNIRVTVHRWTDSLTLVR
jgi:ABC-type transport system substrate-binding protein